MRVIAATNKDLETFVGEGRFRSDLYHRLNVLKIHVPPLRERKEDIKHITSYFLKKYRIRGSAQRLSAETLHLLEAYDWPGNIRELKAISKRIATFVDKEVVDLENIYPLFPEVVHGRREECALAADSSDTAPLPKQLELFERQKILEALQRNHWNITRAACELGLSQSNLSKKLKRYNDLKDRYGQLPS